MIKFKTFNPHTEYDGNGHRIVFSATTKVNEWLEENSEVEIISWQATPVGDRSELYITIQYKEN